MEAKKYLFEVQTCTRCGGSGKYSFCQMYRDRCFKCAGAGVTITKRGAVAQEYYRELCSVPAKELKVGDLILQSGITHGGQSYIYKARISEIRIVENEKPVSTDGVNYSIKQIVIETQHKLGNCCGYYAEDQKLRVYRMDDSERVKIALAFQDTLTKLGKPRKRVAG